MGSGIDCIVDLVRTESGLRNVSLLLKYGNYVLML